MSTKIGHGYRIAGPGGERPDPFTFLTEVRAALEPVYRAAYVTTLATLTCEILDDLAADPAEAEHTRPPRPVTVAHRALREAHHKANVDGHRQPGNDFQCTFTLLADPAEAGGPLYALLYTERDDYTAAFTALPGVAWYGYWDHTDRPDDVTEAEWEMRRATWDRVVGRDTPAERGLSWELLGRYLRLTPRAVRGEVAAAIPTRSDRARAIARNRVSVLDVDQLEHGNFWLRDPEEVAAEVAAETARIEPLLPDLTVTDLFGE